MGLRVRNAPKGAIIVSTAQHIICGFFGVDSVESIEDMHAGNSDVREASVDLAPLIAKEGAIRLLEAADVVDDSRDVYLSL
jgi:hypothetical protein